MILLFPVSIIGSVDNTDSKVIEEQVKKYTNISGDIKQEDIENIKSLAIYSKGLTDVSYLAKLKNLERLDLSYNKIVDISPLAALTNLKDLRIDGNRIKDINALDSLRQLEALSLNNNNIDDISPIENLNKLRSLYVGDNSIEDISALKTLKDLRIFDAGNNKIRDIGVLNDLPNIGALNLAGNPITDYDILAQKYDYIKCDIEINKVNKKESLLSDINISTLDLPSISERTEDFKRVYKEIVLKINGGKIDGEIMNDKSAEELLYDAFYDGDKYVKISNGFFSYSFDGENWSDKKITNDMSKMNIYQIAKGNENYIAVGFKYYENYETRAVIAVSKDGITWDVSEWKDIPRFESVAWNGKHFIIVGMNRAFTSLDGKKWTEIKIDNDEMYYDIVYWNGNQFIAIGQTLSEGIYSYTSKDGAIWEKALITNEKDLDGRVKYHISDLLWDGQKYVAVGYEFAYRGYETYSYIIYSNDGLKWNKCNTEFSRSETLRNIVKTTSGYYAIEKYNTILFSEDGINWSMIKGNPNYRFKDKIKCKFGYYAIDDFDEIFFSNNDKEWNKIPLGRRHYVQKLFFKDDKIMGLCKVKNDDGSYKYKFIVSEDGKAWSELEINNFPSDTNIINIRLCNDYFFMSTPNDTFVSRDGVEWRKLEFEIQSKPSISECFNGTSYILITSNGVVLESHDLQRFTERYKESNSNKRFIKIIWDGKKYYVLSEDYLMNTSSTENINKIGVMYSDDLKYWSGSLLDYYYETPLKDMFVTKEGLYIINNELVLFSKDGLSWERQYYKYDKLIYIE